MQLEARPDSYWITSIYYWPTWREHRVFWSLSQPCPFQTQGLVFMQKFILLAGAAMLAATSPAIADPGKGKGNNKHATMNHGKGHKAGKATHGLVTSDRFGRL